MHVHRDQTTYFLFNFVFYAEQIKLVVGKNYAKWTNDADQQTFQLTIFLNNMTLYECKFSKSLKIREYS